MITIQSQEIAPGFQWVGVTAVKLRVYALQSFIAADGTPVQVGGGNRAFYDEFDCDLTDGILTIPEIELPATTDGNPTTSTYVAYFYSGNRRLGVYEIGSGVTQWKLTDSPASVTWNQVYVSNLAAPNANLGNLYWTEQQTRQYINSLTVGQVGFSIITGLPSENSALNTVLAAKASLTGAETLTNKTLTAPVINDFSVAVHNHQNNAGGGQLAEAALALTDLTTNNSSSLRHGFLPKLSGSSSDVLKGDGTWGNSSGAVSSVFGRTGAVVAASNDYTWAQVDKTTSSLADIATRSASDLSSGTLPDARFPSTLPAASGANLTSLSASNISSGTLNASRLPDLSATYQPRDADLDTWATKTPYAGSLVITTGKTATISNTLTLTATDGSTLAIGGGGTLGTAAYTNTTAYEVPLTFSTGLTRSTNTITVNTSQNIAKLSNLTSNGFVKTSSGDGTLSVDTNTYLTGNQTITLSGDVSGTGATSITTTIGAGVVTNTMLAGSIADTKLLTISTAGKVSDSALSSNIPLKNGTNVFSALQTISDLELRNEGYAITIKNSTGSSLVGRIGRDGGTGGIAITSDAGNLALTAGGSAGNITLSTANSNTDINLTPIRNINLSGLTVATRKVTITQGAANESVLASTGYLLTGSNAQSLIDLAGTWNTSGTPTLIKANLTNTASAGTPFLLDLQVGGVTQFNIGLGGTITSNGGMTLNGPMNLQSGSYNVTWDTSGTMQLGATGANFITISPSGLNQWHANPNDLMLDTGGRVQIGDAQGGGNATQLDLSDAGGFIRLNNILGPVILGDVFNAINSTTLEVDDTTERINLTAPDGVIVSGKIKVGGTASRATTDGTNQLVLFNGTAPAGTLSNGASFFCQSGEMKVADASGNITLLSPHDKDGNWIHDEVNFKGRRLRVDMERLLKAVDKLLGGGFIQEFIV